MTEVERFEFEAHYFDCAECAEDVRLGDMIRQEARRAGVAMAPNTQPGRPCSRPDQCEVVASADGRGALGGGRYAGAGGGLPVPRDGTRSS